MDRKTVKAFLLLGATLAVAFSLLGFFGREVYRQAPPIPERVVAEVEVAPNTRVKAWTYDGLLPGPFIRAKVGDRLIVHF